MFIHVIRKNENLNTISREYNVPISKIIHDNALVDINRLLVGQSLIIKPNNFLYTIKSQDSLFELSKRFKVSVQDIIDANPQIIDPNMLSYGQEIKIVYDNPKKVSKEINGFAYPSISIEVLRQTLPYLTYLSVFSYLINEDGTINDLDDERLIREAYRYSVVPLMTITNISSDESGEFNTELIGNILNNNTTKATLIESILQKMKEKDYLGVVFDFEYLEPKDKDIYNKFLSDAKARFDDFGYILISALAPKVSSNQKGLLYEAHDYKYHGDVMDRVILMTYEWGYLYGPAMPVAPIDEVNKVIEYAVTVIPPDKILMGIPNYGYDFELPFIEGEPAQLISNNEAIEIGVDQGVGILFDVDAQSPYFNYYVNGQKHEVHFEDPRSITAKISLAIQYNLKGFSYWTINEYFIQNLLLIDYYIDVIKII